MKRILVTGGAGFIGSHLIEGILETTDWEVVVLDRLDISGNLLRLTSLPAWEQEGYRVRFVWWDLKAELNSQVVKEIGDIDFVWHLAASSHVDRSIADPLSFVMDNVVGTCNLLEYARKVKPSLVINFGTDEVFGPAQAGTDHKEWDGYNSSNPYAASKAGAEELCVAYANTYKLPVITTHAMNVYGERQHPEKFIPNTIRKTLNDEKILIHADSNLTRSVSRRWIHAKDIFRALMFLNTNGAPGDKYNIVSKDEVTSLEIAQYIAEITGRPLVYEMVDLHNSRPGGDLRYSLDGDKMEVLGFRIETSFSDSIKQVVEWYINNANWLGMEKAVAIKELVECRK